MQSATELGEGKTSILIVYVLLESADEANDANFLFYVRESVEEDDGYTHVILIDPKRVLPYLICTFPASDFILQRQISS